MRVASSPWCRPIGYPNLNWEIDPTTDGATYDGEPKDPTRNNVATTTKQRRYNDYNFRSMITSAQQQRFYNTYTHRLVTTPPPPQPTAGEFYNSCQYRWPSANFIIAIIRCLLPTVRPEHWIEHFSCLITSATFAPFQHVNRLPIRPSTYRCVHSSIRQPSSSPPHPRHAWSAL